MSERDWPGSEYFNPPHLRGDAMTDPKPDAAKVCGVCGSNNPAVRGVTDFAGGPDFPCDNDAFHAPPKPDPGKTHFVGDNCKGGHLDFAQHPDLLNRRVETVDIMPLLAEVAAEKYGKPKPDQPDTESVECPSCRGAGCAHWQENEADECNCCPTCSGTGKVEKSTQQSREEA